MANPRNKLHNLFIGRDESWLGFNRRVLEEAQDKDNPLLERVKFLAITASNLDEFVEIRVAGIMQRIEDGYKEPGFDGLTPQQTLDIVVDGYAQIRPRPVSLLDRGPSPRALQERRSRLGVGPDRRGRA